MPVAAASIGQVYRATLHDGREVAVKVQYPGIRKAVRSDMQNMRVLVSAYQGMHPALDLSQITAELAARITEELDYELEATNTRDMAAAYRDHPFIRVPGVVDELSSADVLVTEWLDGRPLSDAYDAPLAERNRIAEILFRFYSGSAYHLRMFTGDPHQGNLLLLDDGSVGFLDFGLLRRISSRTAEVELATMRAGAAGDAEALGAVLREHGFVPAARGRTTRTCSRRTFTPPVGTYGGTSSRSPPNSLGPSGGMLNPRSETFATTRSNNLPAEHLFRVRAELQLVAMLGALRPQLALWETAREWIADAGANHPAGARARGVATRARTDLSNAQWGRPSQN